MSSKFGWTIVSHSKSIDPINIFNDEFIYLQSYLIKKNVSGINARLEKTFVIPYVKLSK